MGKLAQLLSGLKSVGDYQAENTKRLSDLKNEQQTQRRNDLAIERDELTIEDMRRKMDEMQQAATLATERKAQRDAILQAGGGVKELISAGLMDEALALQTQQSGIANNDSLIADRTSQAANRKLTGEIDTAKALTDSIAPEVPLTGEVYPPMSAAAPGAPLTQARTEAATMPLQTPIGGVMREVPSRQDNRRVADQEAVTKARLQQETERSQQEAIAANRAPPAPRNIDPNSPEGIQARLDFERQKPQGIGASTEPLVAVMGPDGQPVLMKRSDAEGKRPASTREQGRPVPAGEAGKIADFTTSLNDLAVLKKTILSGSTGTSAKIGAMLPDAVTDFTGWGTVAKQKQGVIDRVKQVIGKALEGGVLRKEDEYKYEKILPKLADTAEVVASKLADLETAITLRRQTALENLEDAGYDVSKFMERNATPSGAPPETPAEPSETLIQSNMRANPTMTRQQVIEELKK